MPTLLKMYADCLSRTPRGIVKSPWVVAIPMAYAVIYVLLQLLVSPLGIIGGLIMGFVACGVMASMLYVIEELVAGNPVRPAEFVPSLKRYFWPVMNVLFIFWIASFILGPMLSRTPNGDVLMDALYLVLFILLNATPEAIYGRQLYGGIDILMSTVQFIQDNWIEWFIPNLAFGAIFYFGVPRLQLLLSIALGSLLGLIATVLIAGALLLPVAIFRGHLFRTLDSGGARARRYRYDGR